MDNTLQDAKDRVAEAHALGYEWCDMHRGYVDPDETYVHIDMDTDGTVLLSVCDDCESGHGYTDYLDEDGVAGLVIMDELDPYEYDRTWY